MYSNTAATSDWGDKIIEEVFPWVINQVISRVLFSLTSTESDFYLKTVELPPIGNKKECKFVASCRSTGFSITVNEMDMEKVTSNNILHWPRFVGQTLISV